MFKIHANPPIETKQCRSVAQVIELINLVAKTHNLKLIPDDMLSKMLKDNGRLKIQNWPNFILILKVSNKKQVSG